MDYRVLGPVEAWAGDAKVPIGGPTSQAILATLALSAGRMVSADRLIAAAWGDDPPATVPAQLHNRIWHLRRSLSKHQDVIARRGEGYLLDIAPDRVDALVFERLAAQARSVTGPGQAARRANLLNQALMMWRGPALEGLPRTAVMTAEASRLDELRLGVMEERIEADLALGRLVEAIGELTVLVAEHPLRERLRGLLMIALYRSGRQADALATYQAGRKLLVEELGVEPGPELRSIESAVLASDPALGAEGSTRVLVSKESKLLAPAVPAGPGADDDPTRSPASRRRRALMFVAIGLALGLLIGIPVLIHGIRASGGSSGIGGTAGPHFSVVLYAAASPGATPTAFWTDDQRCGNADEYRLTYDLPAKGKGRAIAYRLSHADCAVKLFDGSGGSGYGEPLVADGRFHRLDVRISGRVSSVVAYSCCNGKLINDKPDG
jgi:DNA-binding SARP family transcriptional activator